MHIDAYSGIYRYQVSEFQVMNFVNNVIWIHPCHSFQQGNWDKLEIHLVMRSDEPSEVIINVNLNWNQEWHLITMSRLNNEYSLQVLLQLLALKI